MELYSDFTCKDVLAEFDMFVKKYPKIKQLLLKKSLQDRFKSSRKSFQAFVANIFEILLDEYNYNEMSIRKNYAFLYMLEEVYYFKNSTRFYMEIDDDFKVPEYYDVWVRENLLPKDRNYLFDLVYKGSAFSVLLNTSDFEVFNKNNDVLECYTLQVYNRIGHTANLIGANIIPDGGNRMYILEQNYSCHICSSKCSVSSKLKARTIDGSEGELLVVSNRKCLNNICTVVGSVQGLGLYDIRNIVFYILEQYANRQISREKTYKEKGLSKLYVGVSPSITTTIENSFDIQENTFIHIRDAKKLKRSHEGSTHDSHKSPREHIRRATTRTLKSGKIVHVKGTIVNKGKGTGSIIYNIDKEVE